MKVSLIIASYNPVAEWLAGALESARGLFDEIILVDDGSDPPTGGATIRQAHGGVHTARNAGIAAASGDVIAQLDDDDVLIRENVPRMRSFIEQHDSDLWHFPITRFCEHGVLEGLACTEPLTDEIYARNQIPSGSWFRKSVWSDLSGFQYTCGEDWDFWARAHVTGKRFTYFPLPVYAHRVRHDSLSYREGMAIPECVDRLRDRIQANCEKLRPR